MYGGNVRGHGDANNKVLRTLSVKCAWMMETTVAMYARNVCVIFLAQH